MHSFNYSTTSHTPHRFKKQNKSGEMFVYVYYMNWNFSTQFQRSLSLVRSEASLVFFFLYHFLLTTSTTSTPSLARYRACTDPSRAAVPSPVSSRRRAVEDSSRWCHKMVVWFRSAWWWLQPVVGRHWVLVRRPWKRFRVDSTRVLRLLVEVRPRVVFRRMRRWRRRLPRQSG